MPGSLLQISLVLLLLGAFASLLVSFKSKTIAIYISGFIGIAASVFGTLSGLMVMLTQSSFTITLGGLHMPFVELSLVVDQLAAFFVFIICLAGIPVSLFSIGYLQAEYMEKQVGVMSALHHLFMLSMLLVVLASNALSFLIFWECMAVFSFCLVIFDVKSVVSRKAGFIYLVMTHVGTAFIFIMYLLLSQHSGALTFASFAASAASLSPSLKAVLFGCAIIGFGAKAGLIPLHIWLPEAHPAAPSHISALMSGVMLKTAVYGLIRCVFYFLSPFPEWWGVLLICVALVTALLGITYASVENDFKRMLAYSSIENMGIIFLAVGLSMFFTASNHPVWANLFMIAALLHSLNHSVFKNLLFMAAGSVISVTHTRSLDNMGGLIHKMPATAIFFLIGAMAISALPLFNGFLSEWMIFQGMIASIRDTSEFFHIFLPLGAAILGFTGAFVAATFVKVFTGAFLAMPRSHHANHAHEVSGTMLFAMSIPALLCLFIGLTPGLTLPVLADVSKSIMAVISPEMAQGESYTMTNGGYLRLFNGFGSYAPVLVMMALIGGLGLAWLLPRWIGKRVAVRKEITWSCGVTPAPEFEYTPTGFSQPLEVAFSKFHSTVNGYHQYLYIPAINGMLSLSRRLRVLQGGNIQIYLAYILITLVGCLLWIKL